MRKIIIILTTIVIIAGGILIFFHYNRLKHFEPLIKLRLSQMVEDASGGLYHLDIEQLQTNAATSRLTIINAHLIPDTAVYAELEKMHKAPNDLFDVFIGQLGIDNLSPVDLASEKTIRLRRLFIGRPVIKVWHKKQPYRLPAEDSTFTIFQRLKKDIRSVKVDTIILQNVDCIYTNRNKQDKQTRFSNVKLFFTDILLDSSTQYDKQRFLFAKNGYISMDNYALDTGDSLYRFSMDKLLIQTNKNAMQLHGVQLVPLLATDEFYERIRHQQDRVELSADAVHFENIDWWAMLAGESFSVRKIMMTNSKCAVYNDKYQAVDTRSKLGKYPHQLLMKLPFLIRLDTISLRDLDLSYTEKNPRSGAEGTLNFDNMSAVITNVTNDSVQIKTNPLCRVSATATFMNQAPFSASLAFDLAHYKKGNFSLTAAIGAMEGSALNSITVPMALLKVNNVQVRGLEASVKGDNNQASGTVNLMYDNLQITALKKGGDTARKRGLLNFIANHFLIKKSNPLNGMPVRIGHAVYKRDPQKSFFNLVWKTILSGAAKIVGFNKK